MRKRRGSNLTHLQAVERHALRALWERRGVAISAAQYLDICVACMLGQHPMELRDYKGSPVYRVDVRGTWMFAVWSVQHARIVTFLPCREWVGNKFIGKRLVNRGTVAA